MTCFSGKLIAVLLAVWLPLFAGNALASSITMQAMDGDCLVTHSGTAHPHAGHLAQHEQQNGQNNISHKDCSVCHLACCGYMAASDVEVAVFALASRVFTPASTQFQSITSAPQDPPPLSRA